MSILVEIAGRADVSVEGVVRVLTREPVSSAVKERVLEVLDQLDAEQTRVLERFALAAVHDVVPLDSDHDPSHDGADTAQPSVHEGQLAIGEAPVSQQSIDRQAGGSGLGASHDAELPVGLGTLLEELVSAVWEMRHERRSERQERLDDLAVLVDLMTSSWQGVDRRLARLEQLVARREASWRGPAPAALLERSTLQPVPVESPSPPAPPPPSPPAATDDDIPAETRRSWPPLAGTLLLLVCLVGVLLAFDLLPSRAEGPSFLPASENGSVPPPATGTGSSATQSQSTPPAPTQTESTRPQATQPQATQPQATQPQATRPRTTRPSPPAQTTAPAGSPQQPRGTSTGADQQAVPPAVTTGSSTIEPARVFVWPPVGGAIAYSVRFFRAGKPFYAARVSQPRVTVPKRIVFQPGAYRWVVRPDTGAAGLGSPIIDSAFSVAKP